MLNKQFRCRRIFSLNFFYEVGSTNHIQFVIRLTSLPIEKNKRKRKCDCRICVVFSQRKKSNKNKLTTISHTQHQTHSSPSFRHSFTHTQLILANSHLSTHPLSLSHLVIQLDSFKPWNFFLQNLTLSHFQTHAFNWQLNTIEIINLNQFEVVVILNFRAERIIYIFFLK